MNQISTSNTTSGRLSDAEIDKIRRQLRSRKTSCRRVRVRRPSAYLS